MRSRNFSSQWVWNVLKWYLYSSTPPLRSPSVKPTGFYQYVSQSLQAFGFQERSAFLSMFQPIKFLWNEHDHHRLAGMGNADHP